MPLQGRPTSHARGTLTQKNRAKTSVLKMDALIFPTLTNTQRKAYPSIHPSISINQPINHPPAVPHSWCVYVSTAIKAHLHYTYWKSQKEENPNHTGKEHLNPASSLKKRWDWLLNQYWLVLNKIEKWRTIGRGEDMYEFPNHICILIHTLEVQQNWFVCCLSSAVRWYMRDIK